MAEDDPVLSKLPTNHARFPRCCLIATATLGLALATLYPAHSSASHGWIWGHRNQSCQSCPDQDGPPGLEVGGTWYWLRTPEQEKQVVMGLFNRYCIRCHGVDGRGVWDIPNIPNFTNVRWQQSRSDPQLVNIILNGRGAVMPPFRGVLTLEESWAMARYLRTFVPGNEMSQPDLGEPKKSEVKGK
jgi:hypothetical protein